MSPLPPPSPPPPPSLRHWVKVILLLLVVMGIAWVANILFLDVRLFFIAYIMTIFIAGQGILIFILLVPFSKEVCLTSHWWVDVDMFLCAGEGGLHHVVEFNIP